MLPSDFQNLIVWSLLPEVIILPEKIMLDYNNTPSEIKRKLASSEDTPADVLEKLSKDSDRTIRAKVASNPNTPTEVLLELGRANASKFWGKMR